MTGATGNTTAAAHGSTIQTTSPAGTERFNSKRGSDESTKWRSPLPELPKPNM